MLTFIIGTAIGLGLGSKFKNEVDLAVGFAKIKYAKSKK